MSTSLHDVTQSLIQFLKKDPDYQLDPYLTTGDLLQINIRRVISLLRGFFRTVFRIKTGGFLFLGAHVVFHHSHLLTMGRGVVIEDYVTISALSKKGIQLGDNVKIARFSIVECTGVIRNIGEGISIGSNSAVGAYSYLGGQGGITIGQDVIMGAGVSFHSENHNYENPLIPIRQQGEIRKGIVVEDDCWIGAKSIILDGIHIGKGSIIAAGSVVTKNIPGGCVVAGVPARVIKER